MPQIHKRFGFLLKGESPDNVTFDLVYRAEAQNDWPARTLIVDYDRTRFGQLQPNRWQCAELEDLDGPCERLLIQVAQFDSLQQVKRDVYAASRILSPHGELRVTVPPKSGAKRITSDLQQVFGIIEVAKNAGGSLIICRQPVPKPFPEETAQLYYPDPISERTLNFSVRPGIFSSEKIDTGTALLLSNAPPVAGKTVLDVGCGYGVIGITAAARGAAVTLLDVDARVVKLAKMNLTINHLVGDVRLKLQPYNFADSSFDVVLSNPPTHAGSSTLRELFNEMVRVSRGDVVIVIREHLNYEKWLVELGDVRRLATAHGFKVLSF
jgi:16S rRNA (guanine1207-N2)-methyltransferase